MNCIPYLSPLYMRAPPGVDLNHFKVASTLHKKTPPPGYRDILAPISLDLTPIGLGEGGIKRESHKGSGMVGR